MKNPSASANSAKPNKHDTKRTAPHRPVRPMEFLITETDDLLVSQSGLALVGALLGPSSLRHRLNDIVLPGKPRPATAHADVIMAMIGLLCLGKSDFADIEAFRDDAFFPRALGLGCVPSEPTLRQRMTELSHLPHDILFEEILGIIRFHAPALTPCFKDWLALDIDVSPFDNSNTKKEGVGWTSKQVDGMAYGDWRKPRDRKRIFVGDTYRTCGERLWRVVLKVPERTRPYRSRYREACRECGNVWHSRAENPLVQAGQAPLIPDIEVATYWTSVGERTATPDEVIALYRDHGTSEQFHSEVKTDLDLERLLSGKFAVNALVWSSQMAAHNLLRLIGQRSLDENRHLPVEDRMPIRKAVHRRRLRSVIQDLMYLAGNWYGMRADGDWRWRG